MGEQEGALMCQSAGQKHLGTHPIQHFYFSALTKLGNWGFHLTLIDSAAASSKVIL